MSGSTGQKLVVYHGDVYLGEVEAIIRENKKSNKSNSLLVNNNNINKLLLLLLTNKEIRIQRLSPQSERCPPLSVLHTISSSFLCKLEPSSSLDQHPNLITLHSTCFHESKTAVVLAGEEELHLVAMPSRQKKFPCFWCFSVPSGLYDSCLGLLNMRCLSIVFDLDETLIVANTMKSFEDRIDMLRVWIARESDPLRASGMSAEMKRYMDDRLLLKQYIEGDTVADNGKVFKVQMEEVPVLSDSHERVVRPVIRLPERNIVLTRINPEIRDTSVLVRLRPAWEDLRSYLTAKGRKRFEVYVCTMAERDYALEMWRLLDPEANLISFKQLSNRVVCVKSGSRKSLLNVFKDGMCHPKMAMVIDDRSKVWEDKDQPRVHVVPAFTPYYAPQAETAHAVPVLCVARNVACNVRGYFFKEFDENLIRRISEVYYEDEVVSLPSAPDVSDYMMSEEVGYAPNGNGNAPPFSEGISGSEVEQRVNQLEDKSVMDSMTNSTSTYAGQRPETLQPPGTMIPNIPGPTSTIFTPSQRPSLLGPPVRRDLRNQNSGQPPILSRVPAQIPTTVQPQGGWLVEEDNNKVNPNFRSSGVVQEAPVPSGLSHVSQAKGEEVLAGRDSAKQSLLPVIQPSDINGTRTSLSSNSREIQDGAKKYNSLSPHLAMGVLQEIGRRCGSKVELKTVGSTGNDLQFSFEVLFSDEKIGFGTGKTRKDAQQQAAQSALHSLAEKYVAFVAPLSRDVDHDSGKFAGGNENGFLWDTVHPGSSDAEQDDGLPVARIAEGAEAEPGNTSISANQKHANSSS